MVGSKKPLSSDLFEIKMTEKGRGVFYVGKTSLEPGTMLEICPVIPLTPEEFNIVYKTILNSYIYSWPSKSQRTSDVTKWKAACVCLGNGSLYNHSENPNSHWVADIKNRTLVFEAIRIIHPEEEIVHNYYWPKWMFKQEGII